VLLHNKNYSFQYSLLQCWQRLCCLHAYVYCVSVQFWLHPDKSVRSQLNSTWIFMSWFNFYRASSCASAVLAVVILSVCQTHAMWQNRTMYCRYFDTTWKDNLLFWHQQWLVWRHPFLSEICAQNDPPPSKNANINRFPLTMSQL